MASWVFLLICFQAVKGKDREGSSVGCSCGPGLEVAHITFAILPLARTQSLGHRDQKESWEI